MREREVKIQRLKVNKAQLLVPRPHKNWQIQWYLLTTKKNEYDLFGRGDKKYKFAPSGWRLGSYLQLL